MSTPIESKSTSNFCLVFIMPSTIKHQEIRSKHDEHRPYRARYVALTRLIGEPKGKRYQPHVRRDIPPLRPPKDTLLIRHGYPSSGV